MDDPGNQRKQAERELAAPEHSADRQPVDFTAEDLEALRAEQFPSRQSEVADAIETIELGDVAKVRSNDVSPRNFESFQLLLLRAEQQRRGAFTMTLLVIFGLTVAVGFGLIFTAMLWKLDTAPLREFLTGIVPAELALLGMAISFHYFDPKK